MVNPPGSRGAVAPQHDPVAQRAGHAVLLDEGVVGRRIDPVYPAAAELVADHGAARDAQQFWAEPEREHEHVDSGHARADVVSELVDEDQQADADQDQQ